MGARSSRGRPGRKFRIGGGRRKRRRNAIEGDVSVVRDVDGTWG